MTNQASLFNCQYSSTTSVKKSRLEIINLLQHEMMEVAVMQSELNSAKLQSDLQY